MFTERNTSSNFKILVNMLTISGVLNYIFEVRMKNN